jgi:uncharacterized surface protein with fasciclin (FAS1) repeats
MIKFLQRSFLFLMLVLVFAGCKKKFDEYYAVPSGLGDPIYQTLKAKGNFTHYLNLVDRAGYKDILSTTGWFTVFAPNDDAFNKYFTDKGISSDAAISDTIARGIVKFSLVYNGYRKDQLSIYQISGSDGIPNMGYKRKTTYYDGVQQKGDAKHSKVINTNRNNTTSTDGKSTVLQYKDGDNNNKYIPYFTDVFLAANGISTTDYQTFYPGSTFSGFNVCGASVVNKDIIASNGIIHEINRVILPLSSFDQYIATNPNYSDFRKLMDSVAFYGASVTLTHANYVATGSTDSVYIKSYDGRLAFSLNNENYTFALTASQAAGYSMVVPTNTALNAYRAKILSKFGNSFFKGAPASVIADFINSLMWPSNLWPSQFALTTNYQLESATMGTLDIVDKQILSNGTFYGTSKSQQANVFRTVFGVQYLDPKTSITLQAYNFASTGIKFQLIQPIVKNTIFLMNDDVLTANGWRYNEGSASSTTTAWGYRSSSSGSYSHSAVYRDVIFRQFATGVIPGIDASSLSGSGILESINHEFIKYNNGKVQTSGTLDAGVDLNVIKTDATSVNGTAYYVDGMLSFTNNNVGYHIQKLAVKYPASYSSFYYYLSTAPSTLYNQTTQAIAGVNTGVDVSYTILVPTNAAITKAIKAGLLPGNKTSGALPTAAPSSAADIDLVRKFILYHIVNGASLPVDQRTRGDNYTTMLQNESGASTFLLITNQPGVMTVSDRQGGVANVYNDVTSNQLSNRAIIQSIDNYLSY